MTDNARLAFVLRNMQWELDHAAFEAGGGRLTSSQRAELACRLMLLAQLLQASDDPPVVIDADGSSGQGRLGQ